MAMSPQTLSDREYAARLHQLHTGAMQALAHGQEEDEVARRTREAEIDLTIDYRLGVDFPAERRRQLHRIHAGIEAERVQFAADVMNGSLPPEQIAARAEQLAALLRTLVERAIGRADTIRYLGEGEVLPFDGRDGATPGGG